MFPERCKKIQFQAHNSNEETCQDSHVKAESIEEHEAKQVANGEQQDQNDEELQDALVLVEEADNFGLMEVNGQDVGDKQDVIHNNKEANDTRANQNLWRNGYLKFSTFNLII